MVHGFLLIQIMTPQLFILTIGYHFNMLLHSNILGVKTIADLNTDCEVKYSIKLPVLSSIKSDLTSAISDNIQCWSILLHRPLRSL